MNPHLLKAKNVAEILNVSRPQAFALMKSGEIPTIRFGRCVRVYEEDLEAFIEENSSRPTKNLLAVSATSKPKQVTPTSNGDHNVT